MTPDQIASLIDALRVAESLVPVQAKLPMHFAIVALEALLTPPPPTDTQDVVTPRPE